MAVSRALVIAAALLLAPAVARAQQMVVHSDLPLFSPADENVWPQGFSTEDSIGARSIFPSADWRCVESDGEPDCDDWLRTRMDGVFHPKFIFAWGSGREALDQAEAVGFIALLLERGAGAAKVRVFALQIGVRPGSSYQLFAVRGEGAIRRLERLDVRCRGAGQEWRKLNGGLGIFLTDYCAVESKAALRAMAREALARPPSAVFEYVPEPETAQTTPAS